jgi:hypothetical protein
MPVISARQWMPIAVLLTSTTIASVACDGSSPTSPSTDGALAGSPGGGGGSGAAPGTGLLTVKVTDSPFSDAQAVLVTFSEVSVHRSGTGWQTVPFVGGSERTCDLKKLQGPVDLLGVGSLPAGHYTQIRLTVADAEIFFDNPSSGPACAFDMGTPGGDSADVTIPSGEVKLNRQFTIESGGAMTILLDFDGDKSIKRLGGGSDNANKSNGNNGNGNGRGNNPSDDLEPDDDNPEDGRYQMTPVIGIVSVTAQ